jgi:hypothetical protein
MYGLLQGHYAIEVEHKISDAVHRVADRLEARLALQQGGQGPVVLLASAALVVSCATTAYLLYRKQ